MSRTIQSHHYSNIRVASTFYTPAHSKDGNNISARIQVNAYANYKKRNGEDVSEILSCTAWDKGADILAICLTKGKLFSAILDHNTYDAPTYDNDQIVNKRDGSGPLMRKASSWTIREFALGEDSFKHIMDEIQAGIRGVNWWVKGSQDALNFSEELKRRMALVGHFDPNLHSKRFGFAEVKMPKYTFGAYIQNQPANGSFPAAQQVPVIQPQAVAGVAATPETVAAAFSGAQDPVAPQAPVMPASQTTPDTGNVANFAMPQGV